MRDGPFRRLLLAAALFYIVRTGELAVLGWLIFDLTGSPSRVALVGVVRMTPLLLFGLGIGAVVDRASKRRLVAFAHTLVLAAIASVVVATAAGAATPLHLYLAVFASGIGFAADFSAHRALMAHLVPRTALGTVAALDTTTLTGSYLLGPSLGGLAIATLGFAGAYALLLALVGCSLALVLGVPRDMPGGPPARRLRLPQALRAVAANRTVLAVLLITMVMNACAFPYQFMLPVIARDELAVGPVAYGVLGSAAGLGALFSALAAGAVPPRLAGRVFSGGSLLLLSCIFVFALSRSYPLSIAVLFVGGFGFASFAVLQTSVVLQGTDPALRGRALGAVTLGIGSQPFGALALGGLAEAAGAPLAVAGMSGLGLILVLAVVVALRIWRPPRPDGTAIT
ncbi:MAG: MFS transporter [Spirochaetaceae bacterium]|nr:MFS transporter [Spirochaetaceae bacterium]